MDLKDRVGVATGGNSNLVTDKGDIVTGDGNEAVYLRNPNVGGASDGFALVLDSAAPEGLSWAPAAGGTGLTDVTGSDGVTVTSPTLVTRNVTNDLVTGTDVAVIDAISDSNITLAAPDGFVLIHSKQGLNTGVQLQASVGVGPEVRIGCGTGSNSQAVVVNAPNGNINLNPHGSLNVTATVGNIALTSQAGTVTAQASLAASVISDTDQVNVSGATAVVIVTPTTGGIVIDTTTLGTASAGEIDIIAETLVNVVGTTGVSISCTAGAVNIGTSGTGGDVNVTANANNDIVLTTTGTGDVTVSCAHDETHTVGRNLAFTVAGATGVNVAASNGNMFLSAGDVGGTGEVRIQTGTTSPTRTFQIWDGAGAGQKPFQAASGGSVVDVEARQAILGISNALHAWGFFDGGS